MALWHRRGGSKRLRSRRGGGAIRCGGAGIVPILVVGNEARKRSCLAQQRRRGCRWLLLLLLLRASPNAKEAARCASAGIAIAIPAEARPHSAAAAAESNDALADMGSARGDGAKGRVDVVGGNLPLVLIRVAPHNFGEIERNGHIRSDLSREPLLPPLLPRHVSELLRRHGEEAVVLLGVFAERGGADKRRQCRVWEIERAAGCRGGCSGNGRGSRCCCSVVCSRGGGRGVKRDECGPQRQTARLLLRRHAACGVGLHCRRREHAAIAVVGIPEAHELKSLGLLAPQLLFFYQLLKEGLG